MKVSKLNAGTLPFLKKWGTIIFFILLLIVFSFMRPTTFATWGNLKNIIEQSSILAIVSAGVTVVMITGDMDLSVGSLASLVGILSAILLKSNMNIFVAEIIGLIIGGLCGLLNGTLVAYGGISSFIATLATMTSFGGAALLLSKGVTLFGLPDAFLWLGQGTIAGIPVAIIFMIIIVVFAWLILEQMTFGRRLYAIGGNQEAAFLSGINIKMHRLLSFMISGAAAAFGGIILTSRLASAHPQAGNPLMLNSAAAVFLGMTAFREGEAHIGGTLLGVFIMGILGNGLNILGVNSYVQSILTGGIIILAVLLSSLAKRKN
ncbi:MAG TPA: ABC transporter permease [Rectinema sp.]|nr:ABC transporter permease [Rectinema sp.]